MKNSFPIILVALWFVSVSSGWGQQAWTLESCIDYALKENITIRKQQLSLEKQQQTVESSRMNFLPVLGGRVSQSFNFGKTASPENNVYGDLNTRNSEFGLSMSVPLTGQIGNARTLSMNKLNLQAALWDCRKAAEDVRLHVISGALQVLYQKEVSEVAENQAELSDELYRKYVELSRYGKVSSTQLLESKARAAQDRQEQVQSKNDYRQALLVFTQLLNLPSADGFALAPPDWGADESVLLLTPAQICAQAMQTNAGVSAENVRLAGYRQHVKVMKSGFYPQVSLDLGIGTGYYNIAGVTSPGFGAQWRHNMNKSVMFTLSLPLFNRLETFRGVRLARLQARDQELVVVSAGQELYKEIQQAYCNAVASKEKYVAGSVSEEAGRELMNELRLKYELGRVSGYEYNEARTKWLKADLERIQAKYELELNIRILKSYLSAPGL